MSDIVVSYYGHSEIVKIKIVDNDKWIGDLVFTADEARALARQIMLASDMAGKDGCNE